MSATIKKSNNPLQNSLRLRIQVTFIMVSTVIILGGGAAAYFLMRNTVINDTFAILSALREARADELQLWFEGRRIDIESLSERPLLVQATRDFITAVEPAQDEEGNVSLSREELITDISASYLGQPGLTDAGDGSLYSQVHAQYFPTLQDYLTTNGYSDLYIVDNNGNIIFSILKDADFATNLLDGLYSDTNIARAFTSAELSPDASFSSMVDFEYYEPVEEPSLFLSSPIFDDNERLGTLIFHIPINILDQIMNQPTGLGESGETYLVGADFRFRNDSRFLESLGVETTILNDEFLVDTEGVRSARQGITGTAIIDDYRGIPVLSSWSTVTLQDEVAGLDVEAVEWAILAEVDVQEALEPLGILGTIITVTVVFSILVTSLISYMLTRPLQQLTGIARLIQSGDLAQRAPVNSSDEIGQLASALNRTLDAVANRSRDVEAIVEVSLRATTILDEQRLLQDVTDLTKERFELYHTHIYRMNDAKTTLELKAGAGYVGREMVAEGRTIALDTKDSIVARTARTRKSSVVNEVLDNPEFLQHPLLPKTRAELAVPLIARGEVLGVLDVQSDIPGYFDQNVLTVIETLAAQIASAISNVHLLQDAQRQSRHAEALSSIQQTMQSASSMDEMLQTTAREIAKALRVPYTSIQLGLDQNSDRKNMSESRYDEGVN